MPTHGVQLSAFVFQFFSHSTKLQMTNLDYSINLSVAGLLHDLAKKFQRKIGKQVAHIQLHIICIDCT